MRDLGCNGILFGPLFESTTHGYDTTNHLRIDPRLGTNEDFDWPVAECHSHGIHIILDGVFNHVGVRHPLTQAALRGEPSPVIVTPEGFPHAIFVGEIIHGDYLHLIDAGHLTSVIGDDGAAIAASVLFSLPGIPSIYQGDEQAFRGVKGEGSDLGQGALTVKIDLTVPSVRLEFDDGDLVTYQPAARR